MEVDGYFPPKKAQKSCVLQTVFYVFDTPIFLPIVILIWYQKGDSIPNVFFQGLSFHRDRGSSTQISYSNSSKKRALGVKWQIHVKKYKHIYEFRVRKYAKIYFSLVPVRKNAFLRTLHGILDQVHLILTHVQRRADK